MTEKRGKISSKITKDIRGTGNITNRKNQRGQILQVVVVKIRSMNNTKKDLEKTENRTQYLTLGLHLGPQPCTWITAINMPSMSTPNKNLKTLKGQ